MSMPFVGFIVACLIFFYIPAFIPAAHAEERILSFKSNIKVNPDSSLTVLETIKVVCENNKIKHGIYRDFPTSYDVVIHSSLPVLNRSVGFRVLQTTRDGKPEPRHTEVLYNGIRTYLGSKGVIISPG